MIAMCFDLSSSCIGVTFAQIKQKELTYIKTLAIIPKRPTAKELGYTTKQPKWVESRGNRYQGLLRPGEYTISKQEAERRIAEFKHFSHRELLKNIGKQCGYYLEQIKPNVVAMEKSKSFNGILTTKLLAEIAGGLYFYTGARNIHLYDFDEATIRAKIRKDITEFSQRSEENVALDTKWEIYCRLRTYFEKNYPNFLDFSAMTMDESDSLAVFYYWYTTMVKE